MNVTLEQLRKVTDRVGDELARLCVMQIMTWEWMGLPKVMVNEMLRGAGFAEEHRNSLLEDYTPRKPLDLGPVVGTES